MLNSKQRAKLKGIASKLEPVFQVGKGGVGREQAEGIEKYLKAHEIIKIKILENSLCSADEAASELAKLTGAEVVTVIGSKAVLYKPNPEKPVISAEL